MLRIFLRIITSRWVWRFLLLLFLALLAVLYMDSLLRIFGMGILLLLVLILVLGWVVRERKFSLFWRYWGWWLGSLLFTAVIFGSLAFLFFKEGILSEVSLGGELGTVIIGSRGMGGVGRLIGLAVVGIALVAPRFNWRLARAAAEKGVALVQCLISLGQRFIAWSRDFYAEHPVHRNILARFRKQRPSLPEVQEASLASPRASVQIEETSSALPRIPPVRVGEGREVQAARQEEQKLLPTPTPLRSLERWQLPSVDLLDEPVGVKFSPAEMQRRAKLLEEALASYGVEAKVVEVNTGPTVTQFGVEPGWDRKYKEVRERDKEGNLKGHLEEVSRTRVKVDRITSLANDLALALAAPSIRVEAPVPGKPLVGIEVPNSSMGLATLREAVESPSFQKASARSKLTVALGKSTEGGIVTADLAKMPHLLIAGATGSGKTVCLDSIIASLLMSNTPEELQFLMVDPKRVELVAFSDLPHLTAPVITENEKAVEALKWLSQEMDKRYQKFSIVGAHNIERYNKSDKVEKPLPFLVLIIDELADLLSTKSGEVEPLICRLAQLSRATGIHEVVATQRPSVDVVTGLIKANFPTRISFAVVSQVDSRTILDCAGAEKLLGKGDMLYLPTEAAKPKRLQGFFVSEQEIKRLVEFWSSQREGGEPKALIPHVEGDPLLEQAKQLAREHKQVSVSFLQRQLRIGYPRAAQLMELLQKGDMLKSEEPEILGKGETKDGKGINRDKDL